MIRSPAAGTQPCGRSEPQPVIAVAAGADIGIVAAAGPHRATAAEFRHTAFSIIYIIRLLIIPKATLEEATVTRRVRQSRQPIRAPEQDRD